MPPLEKDLAAAEEKAQQQHNTMLTEEVTPDTIAEVVSAWTGIPAGKMLQGETEKLLNMESVLGERVVGQKEAVTAVSDAAKLWLAERGYDPAYGARPLRRLIQQAIGDQLAKKLLAGDIVDGDTVHVDVADGGEHLDLAARTA